MGNKPFPVARLGFGDALLLVPILSSYGAWICKVCPSRTVIDLKMAAIESAQAKLSRLQESRPATIDSVLLPLTDIEVETITSSLAYFTAHVPQIIEPSQQRDEIIQSCNEIRAYIAASFS